MTIPRQWALRRRMMMAALGGVDVANLLIQGSCTFTDYGVVTMGDGNDYRLLAITQSGNLVIFEPDGVTSCPVNCEVCVIGGGSNGSHGSSHGGPGGAGAYLKNQTLIDYEGGTVVIGAAQGSSSIGGISVSAISGMNGGTGGGSGGEMKSRYIGASDTWWYSQTTQTPGTGDGISKYPFGDESYSLWVSKPHCAGGGGGAEIAHDSDGEVSDHQAGGNGGSNGGNGLTGAWNSSANGQGGTYGGGAASSYNSYSATYYGSGGGGAPYRHWSETHIPGSGYQGIVYVRIPVDQSMLEAV